MPDRWLVVTDLDGTLLNHHDYRVEVALPMLRQLEQRRIPVIFNTSKTLPELATLVQRLDNRHPFIIENGSAIAVPQGYFDHALLQAQGLPVVDLDDVHLLVTGAGIDELQKFILEVAPRAIDFSRCSLAQAMEMTGLSETEARDAQTRRFSVPLLFSIDEERQAFIQQARQAGYSTLQGGRFLHLLGDCSKGRSMLLLRDLWQQAFAETCGIIALGDSPNDLDMLQQADCAVVVNSPSSDRLKPQHANVIYTWQQAPQGWVEGVEAALSIGARQQQTQ